MDVFEKLNLQDLPDEWIEDYSVEVELPTKYEMYLIENDISLDKLFWEARVGVYHWLIEDRLNLTDSVESSESDSSNCSDNNHFRHSLVKNKNNKTWNFFIEEGLKYKALLSLLNIFIKQGKTNLRNFESRQLCYKAIGLYLLLLAIPGSKVFKIFNSTLYFNVIESLKAICENITERSGGFRFEKYSESNKDCDYGLDGVLKDYIFFINEFRFNDQEDSLKLTIEIFICITRLEKKSSNLISAASGQEPVISLCYTALKDLCKLPHGNVDATVKLIMGKLMRKILVEDNHSKKSNSIVKEHSIKFISFILEQVGESSYSGIKSLVYNICWYMIPDRAEERCKYVQLVYEIISIFPDELFLQFEIWIMKLCFHTEVKNKLIGLEVISKLLFSYQKESNSLKFLLGAVFASCHSHSSTVQTKALSTLVRILVSKSPYVQQEVETIFIRPNSLVNVRRLPVRPKKFDYHEFLTKDPENLDSTKNPLPEVQYVISHLNLLLKSKAISVSKAACQVLTNIFVLNEKLMTNNQESLELMKKGCRYLAVSERIQFMQSMTDLLVFYPGNKQLQHHWIQSVLPLLHDPETRSQEKALQNIQNVLLNNIVPFDKMRLPLHKLPWDLLLLTTKLNNNSLWSDACDMWSKNNSISPGLIRDIFSHVGTENNFSAWCILTRLCMYVEIKDSKVIQEVLKHFYTHVLVNDAKLMGSDYVIDVLFMNWKKLPRHEQVGLTRRLLEALNKFNVPVIWIARFMDICHSVTLSFASSKEKGREDVVKWVKPLMQAAEKNLKILIGPEVRQPVQKPEYLQQLIFTLAEAITILPEEIGDETVSMIESLLLDKCDRVTTVESLKKGRTSSIVLGVAVVFLGRLSLVEETTAIEFVPLFASLLTESKHKCVKINSMLALVDLCKKYTSVVESHIPEMCMCLRDSSREIRLETLQHLIGLICEDYLKVRCPLFFHLLIMLLDKEETIQEKVKEFIMHTLLMKNKNIMFQHFIEGLFYYNACFDHPMLHNYVLHKDEAKVFSLNGSHNRRERRQIYTFMWENMIDERRFNLKSKLCTDVIDNVITGVIPLDSNGNELMRDVLHLLCSKELQFFSQPENEEHSETNEVINDDEPEATKYLKHLKMRAISSALISNAKEVVIPILIHLRTKLKTKKSPLMQDLLNCFRDLRKYYKQEVNDLLAFDEELTEEINFGHDDKEDNSEVMATAVDMSELNLRQVVVVLERMCVAVFKVCNETGSFIVPADSSKGNSNAKDQTDLVLSDSSVTSIMSIIAPHGEAVDNDVNNSSMFASSDKQNEPVASTSKTVDCKQQSPEDVDFPGPSTSYLKPQARVRRSSKSPETEGKTIPKDPVIPESDSIASSIVSIILANREAIDNVNNSSIFASPDKKNEPVASTSKTVNCKRRSSDNLNFLSSSTSDSKPRAKALRSKNNSKTKGKTIPKDPVIPETASTSSSMISLNTTQQEATHNASMFAKKNEPVASTSKSVECDQQTSRYLSVSGPSSDRRVIRRRSVSPSYSNCSPLESDTDSKKSIRKKVRKR